MIPSLFQNKRRVIFYSCCFLIGVCFVYSVFIRRAWFERPLDTHHEWLTAHSVCVTKNWLKEGPFHLRFLHILNPASVEFDTLSSREPYISYPPGTFIPVFLLATLFNINDLIQLYQVYNLINHFVVSLILFSVIFQLLTSIKITGIFHIFFSFVPAIIYLFTPPTLYWHQNVFFADQAVMILFALFIYLEMKRFSYVKLNWWNETLFVLTVFLGVLTDWLFIFVLFVALILRISFQSKSIPLKQFIISQFDMVIPALFAMSLFSYQVISMGLSSKLFTIFQTRTEGVTFIKFLLKHFWINGVGGYGIVLCGSALLSLVFFMSYYSFLRFKVIHSNPNTKMLDAATYLIGISTLPCLLQVYTFQQHTFIHDFSALKWAIPLALIPFGIMPIILSELISTRKYVLQLSILLFWLICLGLIFHYTSHHYQMFFWKGQSNNKRVGDLVKRNAGLKDICFAFDFTIPVFPPQRLAYSEKRVYPISKFIEAKNQVSQFANKGATGKIFISENDWGRLKEEAVRVCSTIYKDTDYYICVITLSKP